MKEIIKPSSASTSPAAAHLDLTLSVETLGEGVGEAVKAKREKKMQSEKEKEKEKASEFNLEGEFCEDGLESLRELKGRVPTVAPVVPVDLDDDDDDDDVDDQLEFDHEPGIALSSLEFGRRRPSTLLLAGSPSSLPLSPSASAIEGVTTEDVTSRATRRVLSASALPMTAAEVEEVADNLCWPDNCVFCGVDYETGRRRQ